MLRNYKLYCSAHHMQIVRYGKITRPAIVPRISPEAAFERLWTPEPTTGCWLWLGQVNSVGRPRFGYGKVPRRLMATHWALGYRPEARLPKHLQVNHTCHNGMCVNPNHLYVGTQRENIHDMIRAGRARWQKVSP